MIDREGARQRAAGSVPRQRAAEGVHQQPVADAVPRRRAAGGVPQQRAAEGVPRQRIAEGVPQQRAAESVPRQRIAESVPRQRGAESVPQQRAAEDVLRQRGSVGVLRQRVAESVAAAQRMLDGSAGSDGADPIVATADAADRIAASLRAGGKVMFFGNGGSASDAGHLAAELLGRFALERRPLAAACLSDHTAAMTAIGNDYGYDDVFARQLAGLGRAGDVAVGLSTSGSSANVVRALETARELGMVTVALTGASGGKVAAVVDVCIRVPSEDTPRVQELCMLLGHTLCELVEQELAGTADLG